MSVAIDRWHWMDRGRKMGPVSWEELQSLARTGKLKPGDMVLREGSDNWHPARSAREVEGASGQTGSGTTVAAARVVRPQTISEVQEELDMAGIAPGGLRPVRMFFGLALMAIGIIASMASYDSAVSQGGGKYLIYVGPMVWGLVLVLSSFGGKMKRYDE